MKERLLKRITQFRNPAIPNHIALMPDGTRRGSRKKGISFHVGYQRGEERIREIVDYVLEREKGRTLSFGLVSDDNLGRPQEHLTPLFAVLENALGLDDLVERGVRIQVMGDINREGIPLSVQRRYAGL